ncbi:3-hydroxyacyl-ACP dehydratase [Streptomyces hygroscopicus]|uniref:3-hydroxyacyl-ACP dehydratase FabZ family protein n=1 Tax=Streptomyces hygroscopicus TaxID=1912 RepID=UPI0033F283A5
MTAAGWGPVDGTVKVVDPGLPGERPARCLAVVDASEKVFAGHFPGFAIFPGVCVVEYVQRGALATLPEREPGGRWVLAAVESSRFLSPVYPGDELTSEYVWSRKDGALRCRASAATGRGVAAQIRLRFENRKTQTGQTGQAGETGRAGETGEMGRDTEARSGRDRGTDAG